MNQDYYVLRLRHVFGLLVAAIALAAGLVFVPLAAQAQEPSSPGRSGDATSNASPPTAAVDTLPQVEKLPPMAIGSILHTSLMDPVPPDDLDQLRATSSCLPRRWSRLARRSPTTTSSPASPRRKSTP